MKKSVKKSDNKKLKIPSLYLFFILIASFIMCVGYANINVPLGITGYLSAEAQDGIFITKADYKSSVDVNAEDFEIIQMYQTMLTSDIQLSDDNQNSSITYEMTIYNSTDIPYAFEEVTFLLGKDTYSNEDITFRLDGLKYGDLLESKKSITFNITFYYKDNVLSTNNTLKSVLNFNFKNIYNITYENFSSTSGYPTYALEGNPVSISFGTLDAPIEVKKSDVILSSNNYSYSNYILTINNVDGAIHVRKLTKYTITNLVKNGSFENNLTNWSINDGGSLSYWVQTPTAKYGSKAYFRKPSAHIRNYITQSITWTNGHKYYYFAYGYCTTNQTLALDVANKGGSIKIAVGNSKWTKGGTIFKPNFSGSNVISVNYAESTGYTYVDGIGVVDLTAAFGSGNEPDLAWCDANINYFDGSTTVYK